MDRWWRASMASQPWSACIRRPRGFKRVSAYASMARGAGSPSCMTRRLYAAHRRPRLPSGATAELGLKRRLHDDLHFSRHHTEKEDVMLPIRGLYEVAIRV